jgi:hypothetical protein
MESIFDITLESSSDKIDFWIRPSLDYYETYHQKKQFIVPPYMLYYHPFVDYYWSKWWLFPPEHRKGLNYQTIFTLAWLDWQKHSWENKMCV